MRLLVWKALFALLVYDMLGLGRNFGRMHKLVINWRVSKRKPPQDTVEQVCSVLAAFRGDNVPTAELRCARSNGDGRTESAIQSPRLERSQWTRN